MANRRRNSKAAKKSESFVARWVHTIRDFFTGVRAELRKVTWLSREEVIQYTAVVIVIVAVMAVLVWGFDSIFGFLKGLIG